MGHIFKLNYVNNSILNRDNDGSVNIIISFGWAGSPGRLILFPTELKAPDMGISVRDTRL